MLPPGPCEAGTRVVTHDQGRVRVGMEALKVNSACHTLSFSFSYEFELDVFEITVCSCPYPSVKGVYGRGWLKNDQYVYIYVRVYSSR